ncbi:ABC transporter ATP-binding protein [Kribbella pittospori]|uniref:ABC transporter ATP-binding protein n=1 Tax=Kribbella pittospori TaxID=722689 RepID=UPI00192D29A6|nr:ABC transporter ATP-binding protein [Kribbella pittospori]
MRYRMARIAVLDEATVVAHRLRQAEQADRIVVLDHGRVVKSGTPESLLADAGPYAQLWRSWAGVPTPDSPAGRTTRASAST